MTYLVYVDGRLGPRFGTREQAEHAAEEFRAEGFDAVIVPAPVPPGEPPREPAAGGPERAKHSEGQVGRGAAEALRPTRPPGLFDRPPEKGDGE